MLFFFFFSFFCFLVRCFIVVQCFVFVRCFILCFCKVFYYLSSALFLWVFCCCAVLCLCKMLHCCAMLCLCKMFHCCAMLCLCKMFHCCAMLCLWHAVTGGLYSERCEWTYLSLPSATSNGDTCCLPQCSPPPPTHPNSPVHLFGELKVPWRRSGLKHVLCPVRELMASVCLWFDCLLAILESSVIWTDSYFLACVYFCNILSWKPAASQPQSPAILSAHTTLSFGLSSNSTDLSSSLLTLKELTFLEHCQRICLLRTR